MNANIGTKSIENDIDYHLDTITQNLKKYKHIIPDQRKPTILICGKMGNGKTTTINTLFGVEVGRLKQSKNLKKRLPNLKGRCLGNS